jgi:hypothetical protein
LAQTQWHLAWLGRRLIQRIFESLALVTMLS